MRQGWNGLGAIVALAVVASSNVALAQSTNPGDDAFIAGKKMAADGITVVEGDVVVTSAVGKLSNKGLFAAANSEFGAQEVSLSNQATPSHLQRRPVR